MTHRHCPRQLRRAAGALTGALLAAGLWTMPAQAGTKQITLPCQPGSTTVRLQAGENAVGVDMGSCVCAESPALLKQAIQQAASSGQGPATSKRFSTAVAPGERKTLTFYCVTREQFQAYLDVVRPPPPTDPAQGGFDPTDPDGGTGSAF